MLILCIKLGQKCWDWSSEVEIIPVTIVRVYSFISRVRKMHQIEVGWVFERVFSSMTVRLIVKVLYTETQSCPASLLPRLCCLCVTSSIPYTPPPCSTSSVSVYTLQCQHAGAPWQHTPLRGIGPQLPPGFLQLVLEKRFRKHFEVVSNRERELCLWCGEPASVLCYRRC